jgi:2-C-methyl-D-erythritol 4-phosphate cytidylyltransferase
MIGVVIVAAGTSSRMGGVDKQFAPLAGRPVLAHTVAAFEAAPEVDAIAIVVNPATAAAVGALGRAEGWRKVVATPAGGARRQDSCANGLAALTAAAGADPLELVLVHDGARPLVSPALIARAVAAGRAHGAAIPGLPIRDTVKGVAPDGRITETLDRSRLWLVQTPQVFRYPILAAAYAAATAQDLTVTDDAALLEALGQPVYVFVGEARNLKITTPEDLVLAAAYLGMSDGG